LNTPLAVAFVTSLLLGMRHAVDPDHIVAVTTIVNGEGKVLPSARVGIMWGLGHTLTILLLGGAIILFKVAFTPQIELSLELAVAAMLILLGYLNLTRSESSNSQPTRIKPFAIGAVHGMAGSGAAVLLIVPLIGDPPLAILYLAVFGLGTIAGMSLVTLCIAVPAGYGGLRLQRNIRVASGYLSLAFGIWLGYRIGFVDGLFLGGRT
jgi:hypothetical protein